MYEFLENCSKGLPTKITKALAGKKILITGASGLVGLNIISTIYKSVPNTSITAVMQTRREDLIVSFMKRSIDIVFLDLTKTESINFKSKYDIIIHAATFGQPSKFMADKIGTIQLNSSTLIKLSQSLQPDGCFLFLSTSEIYNGIDNTSPDETTSGVSMPQHVRAPYIESKRIGETICGVLSENDGQKFKSARLALGYGPGTWLNDGRVLNQFILKALKTKKITMLDSGQSIRTYAYISDVIFMLLNILLFGKSSVYNVGGVTKISIKDLAEAIAQKTNTKVLLPEVQAGLTGAPGAVGVNLANYLSEFGHHDFVDLNEGLDHTISWYKNLIRNNK